MNPRKAMQAIAANDMATRFLKAVRIAAEEATFQEKRTILRLLDVHVFYNGEMLEFSGGVPVQTVDLENLRNSGHILWKSAFTVTPYGLVSDRLFILAVEMKVVGLGNQPNDFLLLVSQCPQPKM